MPAAPSDRALALHAAACRRRENSYIDPDTGFFVMSSHCLAARGACCGAGCRHCPFPPAEQAAAGRPPGLPAWPAPTR